MPRNTPGESKNAQERRSERRLHVVQKITIHFISTSGVESEQATIREVSDSGLSFRLDNPKNLPKVVRIEFTSADTLEKLKIPSIIGWRATSNQVFGAAFQGVSEGIVAKLQSIFPGLKEERATSPADRRVNERRSNIRLLQNDLAKKNLLIKRFKSDLKQRVAITGIGIMSPLGCDLKEIWKKIAAGQSSVTMFNLDELGGSSHRVFAARIKDFDPTQYIDARKAKRLNRHTQLACAAASLAVKDSKFLFDSKTNARAGVYVGTSVGGMEQLFLQHEIFLTKGIEKVQPFMWLNGAVGDSSAEIAMHFKLNGASHTICTGSASSTDAIGMGFRAIQSGDLDVALVGGSEAPVFPSIMRLFEKSGVSPREGMRPEEAMKPFDRRREGFVLGEGSAFLVIENMEIAEQRGAQIYAELIGYGNSCDAHHHFASDPLGQGLTLAVNNALEDSRLQNTDVDYVNLHGTATSVGDPSETRAMKRAFGESVDNMVFGSTKPMTGHLLGASGALESAIVIMAMNNDCAPPTLNLEEPDKECDLNFCSIKAQPHKIRVAANVNIGFGGKNAALIFKKEGS